MEPMKARHPLAGWGGVPHCKDKKNKHGLKSSHLCQAAFTSREKSMSLLLDLASAIWVC